jgi:tripartite-type tricarboxylate transporter receptor subunit TctC
MNIRIDSKRVISQLFAAAMLVFPSLVLPSLIASAQAQTYPTKPVRFVSAFAPGGPVDVVARIVGQKLGETWGQQVLIENRAGAAGNIGSAYVAKQPADGYTVLVNSSSFAVNVSLTKDPGYDAERDFIPVLLVASAPNVIVASPKLGVNNLREALERARSGKLNFGTAGAGTTPHLSAEYLFRTVAGVNVTHIPYKSAAAAAQAAMASEVELASVALSGAVPLIKSGKVKGLLVTSGKRIAAIPDVPTPAEAGVTPFEHYTWVGLFLPTGSPAEAVTRLNSEVNKLLLLPDVRERLVAVGFDAIGGSSAEFARYVKTEVSTWAKVVRDTGAKLEQ